jgi:hypothetical protein
MIISIDDHPKPILSKNCRHESCKLGAIAGCFYDKRSSSATGVVGFLKFFGGQSKIKFFILLKQMVLSPNQVKTLFVD